jgi:hypothetical protein
VTESGLAGGELVRVSVASAVAALTPYAEGDWCGTHARDLDLSCRDTFSHAVDCLHYYACLVATARIEPGGTPYELVPRPRTKAEDLVRGLPTYGGMLAAVVEAADPDSRAYHAYGVSDPAGFAAMGALEVVVHAYDIVAGFGGTWRPPRDVATAVVDRLFHAEESSLGAFGPADALLWCCGRIPIPGRPRRDESWRWDGRPAVDRLRPVAPAAAPRVRAATEPAAHPRAPSAAFPSLLP